MDALGLGTELKLNINIEPIGEITMDHYDFEVDVWCSLKRIVTITKSEAIRVDENNYIICVDSSLLGHGQIKAKVTAYVPDNDFEDGVRTEVVYLNTNIEIVKTI